MMTSKNVSNSNPIVVVSVVVALLAIDVFAGTDPSRAMGYAPSSDIRNEALWWSYSSRCPPWDRWPNSIDRETAFRRGFECRKANLEQARMDGDKELEALQLKEIAVGHRQEDIGMKKDVEVAIEVIDQALDIVKKLDEPCWESYLHSVKARFFHSLKDQNEEFELAIRIAAAGSGCEHERAFALGNLASNAIGDASVRYYEEALKWARVDADPGTLVWLLNNISQIHSRNRNPLTIGYHREIVEIFHSTGNRKSEMRAIWSLGVEYEKLGEIEKAIPLYQQYVEYCKEQNSRCMNNEVSHLEWLLDQQRLRQSAE
jgi:tetratricopeptide (TPR) repeat protein